MTRADDVALRAEVIRAIGRPRAPRRVTVDGLSILVDGVEVCRALTADRPAVVRWLRALLRRWSDAAGRRARARARGARERR